MSAVTQATLEMLIKENEGLKKDLASISDGMLKAMLALDARVDELEVAVVSLARRLNSTQVPVRTGEAEVGKEL